MVVASDEWWRGSDEPMRWSDNLDAGEVHIGTGKDPCDGCNRPWRCPDCDVFQCDGRDEGGDCALTDVLTDVLDRLHWMDAKLDLLLLAKRDTTRRRRVSWDRAD